VKLVERLEGEVLEAEYLVHRVVEEAQSSRPGPAAKRLK
jgi:hypothetical protein